MKMLHICIVTIHGYVNKQHDSTAQHSTAQHSTAQHSTAQHSTAQHSTAQHSTAQHRTDLQVGWARNDMTLRSSDASIKGGLLSHGNSITILPMHLLHITHGTSSMEYESASRVCVTMAVICMAATGCKH